MFPSEKYEGNSITLDHGDIAVLFTDGITECRDENNEEFNERRFTTLIKKNAGLSAKELLDKIFGALNAFSKGAEQMDDMTLVIIKRMTSEM
jgi:sigma-B regulation protein RsbU (phosphoserine phosphatase)